VLARCRRSLSWVAARLKDIFYGVGNSHLDIGRLIAFGSASAIVFAAVWNAVLRQPIDLQAFGLGLSAVLTAAVVYIYKDRQGG